MISLKPVFHQILKPFRFGFDGDRLHHQNKLTLITNSLAIFGLLIFFSHSSTMLKMGIPASTVFPALIDGFIFGPLILLANYYKKHSLARYLAILATFTIGMRVFAVAGRTLNGQDIFFVAIVLSLISFDRSQKWLRWTSLGISLIGLPLGDYLVEFGYFPIIDVDWGYPIRVIDSILLPIAVTIGVFMEKRLSEEYSGQLERFNEELELKVQERTKELFLAKQQVEQVSVLKTQFVANTSHELRTPVQGISGYVDLMNIRIEKLNPTNIEDVQKKLRKYINDMRKANNRLSELIGKLLDMTRLQEKDLEPQPSEFSFSRVLQEQIQRQQEEAELKNISINFDDQVGKEKNCLQDKALSSKIIFYLLENSIKFSDENCPISISLQQNEESIQLSFTNKGPGVAEQDIEKIFEPFVQGVRTDKLVGGTGLGLAFAHQYTTLLRGQLTVADASPEHTTFLLVLPSAFSKSQVLKTVSES